MISYPSTIPKPSVTLTGEAETPVIRTDIPNGLTVQDGRFSTGRETYRLQWVMSQAELVSFEEWFHETLAGGSLVFGLELPEDGAFSVQPVRFIGGVYDASHKGGLWFTVSASVEALLVRVAPSNRTPAVPQWLRLGIDPTESQELTFSHRNALLTVRPDLGSETTLRIYPPTDPTQYIYFGVNNQGLGETLITSVDVDPPIVEAVQPFPASLPNVNNSFALKASRRTIRADMDSGHSRQFLGTASTEKSYQVEWEFSLDELQTFQDFFFVTLKSGSRPFNLTLPVDGLFSPVLVRFIGGKYSESYVPQDRFKVSATVERVTAQVVTPPEWQPYPLHYAPTVNVTVNRKVTAADAGKFFVCNPSLGQTVNLHISSNLIEFGVLNKGLGNVLITRTPYVLSLGTFADDAGGVFGKPVPSLRDTILDIGDFSEVGGTGIFAKPSPSLTSVIKDIGIFPETGGAGVFMKPIPSILTVEEPLGAISETGGSGTFNKPNISLQIP